MLNWILRYSKVLQGIDGKRNEKFNGVDTNVNTCQQYHAKEHSAQILYI